MQEITEPTLLLDKAKCKDNIDKMLAKAKSRNLIFRPHFKTHQAQTIGKWFKEKGVTKITVSSLKMANYFANDGWKDITIAFPVNILQITSLNKLSNKIELNLTILSAEVAEFLNKNIEHKTGIFVKIDTGYGRTGLKSTNTKEIDNILKIIELSGNLVFKGFLAHSGDTYHAKNTDEILQIHEKSRTELIKLKEEYIHDFPEIIISLGDTPSCTLSNNFSGIDEIRPGNFVFYDLMQYNLGVCKFSNIAIAMKCPVVAIHPERNQVIIHGGGVHFSKESINYKGNTIYGIAAKTKDEKWNEPNNDILLTSLSQEHGTLTVSNSEIKNISIGDIITIIPIHACLTANLMKKYLTFENKEILHL
ncbi:MAG: alanine racemase [Bacteroidota bacterium]|nr:alanine racemase [Bacteroidota bacterium]